VLFKIALKSGLLCFAQFEIGFSGKQLRVFAGSRFRQLSRATKSMVRCLYFKKLGKRQCFIGF